MKAVLSNIIWMLVCLVTFGASAETENDNTEAILVKASGSVEVLRLDDKEFIPASSGMQLKAGDTIRTGSKGRAFVKMGETVELRLGSESLIEIQAEEYTDKHRRSVAFYLGVLLAKIGKTDGGDTPFEIYTTNAVAGVRGTEFTTAVGLDGAVRTVVTEGRVVLSSEQGAVDLVPGQFSQVEVGQQPTAAAVDPKTPWDQWRERRAQRAIARAPDLAQKWMEQVGKLQARLENRMGRAGEIAEQLEVLSKKARVARHGEQDKALSLIQGRMIKLVRESMQIRSQIRFASARLRGRLELVRRLAAITQQPEFPPKLAEQIKNHGKKSRKIFNKARKQRRELVRKLRRQLLRQRKLLRALKMRYRDFLKRHRDRIRNFKRTASSGR